MNRVHLITVGKAFMAKGLDNSLLRLAGLHYLSSQRDVNDLTGIKKKIVAEQLITQESFEGMDLYE